MHALHRVAPAAALALLIASTLMGCGRSHAPNPLDAQLAEYLGPPDDVRLKFQERGSLRKTLWPISYRQRIENPRRPAHLGIATPRNASDDPKTATRRKYTNTDDYYELWVEDGKLWQLDVGSPHLLLQGPLAVNATRWPLDPQRQPDASGTSGFDCTISAMERLTVIDKDVDTIEVTCVSTSSVAPDRVRRYVVVLAKGYGIVREASGVTRPNALDRFEIVEPLHDEVVIDSQPLIGPSAAPKR